MDIHIIVKLKSSYEAWHNLFLKDADTFETPIELFYSRRIGEKAWGEGETVVPDTLTRYYGNFQDCGKQGAEIPDDQPSGELHCIGKDTLYYDIPIMIKGAGKLIGRTESGFSYGLLAAVTTLMIAVVGLSRLIKEKIEVILLVDSNKIYFRVILF